MPRRVASAMLGIVVFCWVVPAKAEFDAVRASFGIQDDALGSVFYGYAYLRSGKIYLTHDSAYDAKTGRGNAVGIDQSGGEGCRDFAFDSHGDRRSGRQCYRVKQTGSGQWAIHAENKWVDTWPNGGKYGITSTVDFTLTLIEVSRRGRCTLSDIGGEEAYSTPRVALKRTSIGAKAVPKCNVRELAADWMIVREDGAFRQ